MENAALSRVATGADSTPELIAGLVAVLHHALKRARTYERYRAEAVHAKDSVLEQFFATSVLDQRALAQRAQALLLERLEEEQDKREGAFDAAPRRHPP
jgi:hypothetical protein